MTDRLHNHIQNSFAGGVISPKMLLRQDTELYAKSALELTNWLPTPLGSIVRMPGTMYLESLEETDARIIPFLTTANERSLLVLTPSSIRLIRNIDDRVNGGVFDFPTNPGTGTQIYRKEIVNNWNFERGLEGWDVEPNKYFSRNDEGPLGVWVNHVDQLFFVPRLFRFPDFDFETVQAETVVNVDTDTNRITVNTVFDYFANPDTASGGFVLTVVISPNANYTDPVVNEQWTEEEFPVAGPSIVLSDSYDLPTTDWTGDLYVRIRLTARATAEREYSNPQMRIESFSILANGEVELTEADDTTAYTAADLPDIQYVQSPYGDKEIILTHPRHYPKRFYFDTGGAAYVFEDVPFTNAPSEWANNNYPAACTSMQGRLVLAGGQTFRIATGDPVATVSETIWATEVGDWETFTSSPANAADSLELVTVYRSPIQWVYGQKQLAVGALEFEYIVSANEGILTPTDSQVNVHSTHGSINVQPAGFGEGIMFPADAGSKTRFLKYSDEGKGWLAQDISMYYPEACYTGIKRMVRIRNPHQMCWILRNDGQIAIFSSEPGVEGWSIFRLWAGDIKDICVITDNEGRDVPMMLVERRVDGAVDLHLECIPKFSYDQKWVYQESYVSKFYETPTDTITGLDHLEGKIIQVMSPARYLGFFVVEGGEVTVTDDTVTEGGNPGTTLFTNVTVGMSHNAIGRTLPPEKIYPGSKTRYSAFAIRTLASSRMIINGQRPDDREPLTQMNLSQGLDYVNDLFVNTADWDPYNIIEFSEHLPMRSEVLGVYGRLREGKV